MNHFIDSWVAPGVWFMAGWSLRWAILIALVACWFAIRQPRHAVVRDAVWRVVLVAGLVGLSSGSGMVVLVRHDAPMAPQSPRANSLHQSERTNSAPTVRPTSSIASQRAPDKAPSESEAVAQDKLPQPKTPDETLDLARLGMALLAGAWATGVVVMTLQLAAGWWWLAKIGMSARAPGDAAQREFDACRQECNIRETVILRIHSAVSSPVFAAVWQCYIFVPDDWESLSAGVRRGILMHELAHVARGDDRMKLLEEVVRLFFFFHPLVHYLLNRLDAEREEICDAAAVGNGVSPRDLALTLFEYSRRAKLPAQLAHSASGLQFFRQRTVKYRILRLLDSTASGWQQPPSRVRMAGTICVAVAMLFIARGVVLRAADPHVAQRAATPTGDLEGRLVDVLKSPIKNAKVSATYLSRAGLVTTPVAIADEQGEFRLSPSNEYLPFTTGGVAMLTIVTKEGLSYETNVEIASGTPTVHVPTLLRGNVDKIDDVTVGELAGCVVDEHGSPLAGVSVNVGYAHKGHETETDDKGHFRLKGFDRDEKVEVIISKPGYSPETFMQQPTGVPGWIVVMGSKTYFEGTVRTPDGEPVAGALVRANQGPKRGSGFQRSELWTETKADEHGRYRLYVQPDAYELAFEAPGIGVARFDKRAIAYGEVEMLDVELTPGITFHAKCVDSISGEPVAGVQLSHWQNKKLNANSGADGTIVVGELLPGRFEFNLKAKGFARWWSDQALSVWNRKSLDKPELHWQRNFDYLDFDLSREMSPVTIVLEKAVRIRGRIVDPDGNPVEGATAAPALTGTGNSLTGDTRFSVTTGRDGTFEMWLPASNDAQYNLVAHDGKYHQWRRWANGILPPIRTTPGQEIDGLEIRLTRPATVRGIVLDKNGKPVAHREVRAHAADKSENRYYDPTVKTKEDGTFELPYVRPGRHYVQAAPFWLVAEEAPPDATQTVTLDVGQTVDEIKLTGHEMR